MQFTNNNQANQPTPPPNTPTPTRRAEAGMAGDQPQRENPTLSQAATAKRWPANGPFPQDPTVCPNQPSSHRMLSHSADLP
ncbi:hypothetical protein Mame01_70960 [Microbispora amethystogenes]|nr:hypothetical protein Mame01_70960 [Microbispora amethystogenes]